MLLGVGPLGTYTNLLTQLREDGVDDVLVVVTAASDEEEQSAEDLDVPHVLVHVPPAPSLSASIRAEQALLDNLPSEVVEAVEARDPDRHGVWLGHAFLEREQLLGRQVLGGRSREWAALEDKTRCDRLFDAAGAPRPPSVTVPVELDALLCAASDLDEGVGTVWSGDSSAGVNGGADLLRWVRSREDAEDAVRLLSGQCRAARVARFVEGVPCSIHGIVLPDGVTVGRPVELVNLRSAARRRSSTPACRRGGTPGRRPGDDVRRGTARRRVPGGRARLRGCLRARRRAREARVGADRAEHSSEHRARLDHAGGPGPAVRAPAARARRRVASGTQRGRAAAVDVRRGRRPRGRGPGLLQPLRQRGDDGDGRARRTDTVRRRRSGGGKVAADTGGRRLARRADAGGRRGDQGRPVGRVGGGRSRSRGRRLGHRLRADGGRPAVH